MAQARRPLRKMSFDAEPKSLSFETRTRVYLIEHELSPYLLRLKQQIADLSDLDPLDVRLTSLPIQPGCDGVI